MYQLLVLGNQYTADENQWYLLVWFIVVSVMIANIGLDWFNTISY